MYTRAQLQQEYSAALAEYNKTKDQAKFFATLNELSDKVNSEIANNPKNPGVSLIDLSMMLSSNPAFLAQKQQEIAQAQKAGVANQSLDLLNQGIQMAMSLGQVSRAKQAAAQLQRPEIPSVPPSNPQLAQALNQAQLGTINVSDVLRPAQAQIQDAYRSALNQAQVASGGQAGAYQGMANLANLQRMRASLGLAPIAQEAKLQNQQVYNQLLGQRQDEIANQMRARLAGTEMALNQYDKDAQAVGALGSMGRTNALLAGQQLTQSLQGLTPYLFQGQQPTQSSPYETVQNRVANTRFAQLPQINPTVQGQMAAGYTPGQGAYYITKPGQQVVPNIGNLPVQGSTPVKLQSTLPQSPFQNQAENDFYNQVRQENFLRRNMGVNTAGLENLRRYTSNYSIPDTNNYYPRSL